MENEEIVKFCNPVTVNGVEYPKVVVEAFCESMPIGVDLAAVVMLDVTPETHKWYSEIITSHLNMFYRGWEAAEEEILGDPLKYNLTDV